MDGVANHLDDLDALRDEDPDRCESNDDVASHLQLGLDRTFPPLSLKVGHQVLQFALRLGFVTNLNGIIRLVIDGILTTPWVSVIHAKAGQSKKKLKNQ